MTHFSNENSGFPLTIVRFLGKKWAISIFKEFKTSEKRFGELKEKFSITSKVLSEILSEMQCFGLIIKSDRKTFPPTTTYSITQRGLKLLEIVDKLELFSKYDVNSTTENPQYLSKFAILLAIEKAISNLGKPELKRVEDQLQAKFECSLEDCVSNPTPLKIILCELFGFCYEDIYNSIYGFLKDTSMDEDITKFLKLMKV